MRINSTEPLAHPQITPDGNGDINDALPEAAHRVALTKLHPAGAPQIGIGAATILQEMHRI